MLVQYAITWHVALDTLSGIWVTLFTCAAMLPTVIISPFAGVWADRYNRKTLINIADGAIAVSTLILAFVIHAGHDSIILMLIVVAMRGFGQGVQQPSVSALIPQLVPAEHLARFNGIQATTQSLTMFASPMLAGVLVTFLPIQYIFFIDVATAAIGIAVVFFCVHVTKPEYTAKSSGFKAYIAEIKEGLDLIMQTPWLRLMLLYMAGFCICMAPAAMLTPLQAARTFGQDYWRLTAIEMLFSIGMMAGGIAISIWGGFRNRMRTITLACFAFGLTTFLFGVVPNFWIYLGVMLLCGATVPFFNTPAMTIMQTQVEPHIMGRVMSVSSMINGVAMPLGMLIFGPLGDVVRIETLLIIAGTLLFASGFVLLASKSLIAAGEPTTPPSTEVAS
jgi:DHA3 family macrolide efflux protein-like MFS transporter